MKNLVLVFVSLVFTLGMLEGAARLFKLGTGGFWEPHELLGWHNIPNASGWESCYGECQVHVRINSLGLRDREIPYEKQEMHRILFLGDSITAGMQVPLEDTFVKQLEMRLNADESKQWETINAAVNGYGTDNELLFYQLEGQKYDPDVVVLGVYLANDVYNNSRELELRVGGESHKPYFTLTEEGELELQNYPVEDTDSFSIRIGTFLKKHFQLPRFVAQTLSLRGEVPDWLQSVVRLFSGNRGVQAEEQPRSQQDDDQAQDGIQAESSNGGVGTICDAEYSPEIAEAWVVTKALIQQLRSEVEASGAEFMVLSIPTMAQTIKPKSNANWYCVRPNEELNSFLEAENIPYLDLLQSFRDYSPEGGKALYYVRDFHINEAGHHLAGEQLKRFVQEAVIDR